MQIAWFFKSWLLQLFDIYNLIHRHFIRRLITFCFLTMKIPSAELYFSFVTLKHLQKAFTCVASLSRISGLAGTRERSYTVDTRRSITARIRSRLAFVKICKEWIHNLCLYKDVLSRVSIDTLIFLQDSDQRNIIVQPCWILSENAKSVHLEDNF